MFDRKWTIQLIPDERNGARQITIPLRPSATLLGGIGVLGAALLILVIAFVGRSTPAYQTHQLQKENALLVEELREMRGRVGSLEGELEVLAEKDSEMRVIAGLDPIDEDVLAVGVGGPGSPSLEAGPLYEISPEAGAEAFAASYDLHALERRAELLRESMAEAADSLLAHRDLLESTPSILPAAGRLTSGFSRARFHPIHHRELPHEGIDVSAPLGTPIMAAANGRISFSGRRSGYGLVVEIDHGHGYKTVYGHTSETLVRSGQEVARGDVIARVGRSGLATSPHLHYEIRVNGLPVNPMNYIITGAVP